jgi:uncharacterized Tic20 family protein
MPGKIISPFREEPSMSDSGFTPPPPQDPPSALPPSAPPGVPIHLPSDGFSTNSEERSLGMLAHVLQIFSWFIGPLIIYFVRRDSRFVRYHALQAVFWQLTLVAVGMVGMVIFFASLFGSIAGGMHTGSTEPPHALFLIMPIFWLGWMCIWVLNLILGIVYGIRAFHGEWSGYPVIKYWAARAAGFSL